MQLKPHQEENAQVALQILKQQPWVYIAGEVRTGKTLTALRAAGYLTREEVLFITKKKAIAGIESSYQELRDNYGVSYRLTVINYESVHLLEKKDWAVVICDESHSKISGFPKPSATAKLIKEIIPEKALIIYLSGI